MVGQKLGRRETLRITAVLYVVSALGCGLAWNWPSFLLFRFVGGLGIGASSVLGPVYIAELAPAKWRGRLVAAFQFNVVFGIHARLHLELLDSHLCTWARPSGDGRWASPRRRPWSFWRCSSAFRAVRAGRPRATSIDEALAVLKLMGEPDPEAELADIRAALAQEHATAHERVFQWKYRYPLFLAISIGAFNQLAGINAILYYLNNIFAAAGFSQISSDQQAIAIGATNFLFTIVGMSSDRQDWAQDASADRCGGMRELSCRRRVGVQHAFASRRAALAAGRLHCLLQRFAGRGHLGLHRRNFSHVGARQGTGRGQRQPLVHEHVDRSDVSRGGEQFEHGDAICVLCGRTAVQFFVVRGCLSGDQGANAGAVAAQADAGVGPASISLRRVSMRAALQRRWTVRQDSYHTDSMAWMLSATSRFRVSASAWNSPALARRQRSSSSG